MDDFLSSLSDEESLIILPLSLIPCLKACGFRLTKWVSNSKVILENIPSSELSPKFINLDLNSQPTERVLGMIRNVSEDFLVFKPLLKQCVYTKKRGILGIVASIFNPFGILTPSILEAKLIIQSLWAENVGWDDQIPDCLEKTWSNWYQKLKEITNVALARWIGYYDKNKYYIELLILCDASSVAYGVVLTNLENKEIKCSFILAKSRLSPMKEKSLSIPRLELQAAVLGARTKSTILKQVDFQIDSVTLHTDSKVTLNCISNSSRKFLPFVMNQLNEFRTNLEIKQLEYIPGDLNPTGMCTRYHLFQYLNSDSIWIRGPNFLYRNENENAFEYVIENNETENFNVNLATNSTTKSSNSPKFISSIKSLFINLLFINSLFILFIIHKLLKHIAWILRLKQNYISYKRNKEHKCLSLPNLNIQDPPGNKTSWQRRNNVSLYAPATSQVHLK